MFSSGIASREPIPKLGVVANGRLNVCLPPLTRAVPGSPHNKLLCVVIPHPPSGELPKLPRGIIPGFTAASDTAQPLPQLIP